jgi:hypothetical protein
LSWAVASEVKEAVAWMFTVLVIPPIVAATIAHPFNVVDEVNWKDALEAFTGMINDAGTTSAVFVDFRVTVEADEEGAVKLTVQVPGWPAFKASGHVICESADEEGESEIAIERELDP